MILEHDKLTLNEHGCDNFFWPLFVLLRHHQKAQRCRHNIFGQKYISGTSAR